MSDPAHPSSRHDQRRKGGACVGLTGVETFRHSIIGGVIGVGIAALGGRGVQWGWKGVSQVFAAWVIAPGIAGIFGAILFLTTKYLVLKRKNPLQAGLALIPVFFFITSGVLTMLVVWKGGETRTSRLVPEPCGPTPVSTLTCDASALPRPR